MAISRKRSSTSTDTPPTSTSVTVKKAKVTHDATPEPAPEAHASGSPSRRRSGGATSTVLWIRNPPSHLPPLKENPCMEKEFVGHFSQIKVGPCIARANRPRMQQTLTSPPSCSGRITFSFNVEKISNDVRRCSRSSSDP
jgi:hypothetical protein